MTTGPTSVNDDEELYRRVRERTPASQLCFETVAGRVVFSQAAFNDPQKRPSVDRAILCSSNPHRSRLAREDGIVALNAAAIRKIGLGQPGQGRSTHVVDVLPDPVRGNLAHAVIVVDPAAGSSIFKRLKEALAHLATEAGWRVEPGTPLLRWNFVAILYDASRRIFRLLRTIK
jgi:hypothetical protein